MKRALRERLSAALSSLQRAGLIGRVLVYLGGIILLQQYIPPAWIGRLLAQASCTVLSCTTLLENGFILMHGEDALLVTLIPACTGIRDILYYYLLMFLLYGTHMVTRYGRILLLSTFFLIILTPLRIILLSSILLQNPILGETLHTAYYLYGSFVIIILLALIPLLIEVLHHKRSP